MQGLLAEGYGGQQSGKIAQGTEDTQVTEAQLAPFILGNYFENTYKGETEPKRLPGRSKKLEVDEADPDMPLSFSWARAGRLRSFFMHT